MVVQEYKSGNVIVNTDDQLIKQTKCDSEILTNGVTVKEDIWNDQTVTSDKSVQGKYSLSINQLGSGKIVALEINDNLKKYAYRIKLVRPYNSENRYECIPCHGNASKIEFYPNCSYRYSRNKYSALESDVNIYSISDLHILKELGLDQAVVSLSI